MATRDKHRAYYAKRVGRMWQVWFMRQDGSSDVNGAFEWRASSLQFYRKINAERLANDLWQSFNDGVWVGGE